MSFIPSTVLVTFVVLSSQIAGQTERVLPAKQPNKQIAAERTKTLDSVTELLQLSKKLRGWVRDLSSALQDGNEEVRFRAAQALGEIGPSAALQAAPNLGKAVFDESARVRLAALEALMQMGPVGKYAVPDLVAALEDDSVFIRRRAATALGIIRSGPDLAVPALIKALQDKDDIQDARVVSVRLASVSALGNFGPAAKTAIPSLLELLKSEDTRVRAAAIAALGKTRSELPIVVPRLLLILNDPKEEAFRAAAAAAFGYMGPDGKEAIPDLLRALKCENLADPARSEGIRASVLRALGSMRTHAAESVPSVIKIAADPNMHTTIRNSAILTLGEIGAGAKETIPFLVQCLNDRAYNSYDLATCSALQRIGRDAVQPLIDNLIKERGPQRGRTISALGIIGPQAADAIPFLEAELSDRAVRTQATSALRKIQRYKKS